jgi:hypothetical protein
LSNTAGSVSTQGGHNFSIPCSTAIVFSSLHSFCCVLQFHVILCLLIFSQM